MRPSGLRAKPPPEALSPVNSPQCSSPGPPNLEKPFWLYPLDEEGYSTGPYCEDVAVMPEMLDGYYPGLSEIATKQCVAYSPAMSAVAAEFVLVEVENAEDVEKAETILQTRIDSQIAGGAWYPETIEAWENNARLAVNGNSLMLVVWEGSESIVESFNGLFA